ncbi:Hypothetical protein R9X50_00512600 [Acrodontium crateriforme]|uniref:Alpha/beta hydrolase fold-3 domain-containing protein n=1 Tax=Acrodontium crateriforme TaxID=150365 RepID=A0AAQ3M7D8_9PEZI|nr:Hypothetical protein R9X50_00512600 [Acrodontium crateriforme]
MGAFDTQPGKAIWTLSAVGINLFKFPWLVAYYLPSSTRPHRAWTLRQALQVQIIRAALWHMAWVKMITPLKLSAGKERERWVVVKPGPEGKYVGPTRVDGEIVPAEVGGTWYPALPDGMGDGFVVLHFHGGAYMIGDGRTQDAGFAATTLLRETDVVRVFAPQYRLSCNALSRFPAALQDAISAYRYLIDEVKIPAARIVVGGDSAGGNLTLALLRYLTEYGSVVGLPQPACAWLWSPWVSPGRSLNSEAFDGSPNASTDYVTAAFGQWGAESYLPAPSSGIDLDSPYINFYDHTFATSTPLYISTGECEVLYHDDVKLVEDFAKVKGNKVQLQVEEHCVHDIILAGKLVGFEKEAALAAKRAGEFLKTLEKA